MLRIHVLQAQAAVKNHLSSHLLLAASIFSCEILAGALPRAIQGNHPTSVSGPCRATRISCGHGCCLRRSSQRARASSAMMRTAATSVCPLPEVSDQQRREAKQFRSRVREFHDEMQAEGWDHALGMFGFGGKRQKVAGVSLTRRTSFGSSSQDNQDPCLAAPVTPVSLLGGWQRS